MLADAWGTELGIPELLLLGWCCWVKVHDVTSDVMKPCKNPVLVCFSMFCRGVLQGILPN